VDINRRDLLGLSLAVAASGPLASGSRARAGTRPAIRAVALDAFTTFDPRPVSALAERLFPGQGAELAGTWRARQFEYTWLRTLMGRYADFWQVTEEALVASARLLGLELGRERRDRLMQAFLELRAWPDAPAALRSMREAGIRLAFLSNFTAGMLDAAVASSGLEGLFEPHLTTDRVRAYKPDPRAYRMGIEAFRLSRDEIAFAAFGGWDAAGARAFGYPTVWVNRAGVPPEELGSPADATGATLGDLARFVLATR
jgi:2-haloacid dehalogenase